ncbi:MAG: hypothetical protein AB7F09_03120, partial [Parvibaculaceae bacterium]
MTWRTAPASSARDCPAAPRWSADRGCAHRVALELKQRLTKANEVIDQYIDINQVILQDQS